MNYDIIFYGKTLRIAAGLATEAELSGGFAKINLPDGDYYLDLF